MKLRILAGLLAMVSLGAVAAADNPPDVRDIMSANQFHATGLDARSPEQLEKLTRWLPEGMAFAAIAAEQPKAKPKKTARKAA